MPRDIWASSEDGPDSSDNGKLGSNNHPSYQRLSSPPKSSRQQESEDDALPLAKRPTQQQAVHRLLLSFIENRCITQAAEELNEQRQMANWLPNNHPRVQELAQKKFKVMTKDMLGNELRMQGTSEENLRLFDAFLHNTTASKDNQKILLAPAHLGALIRRKGSDQELDPVSYSLADSTSAKPFPQSWYTLQYEELSLLGSGGEGAVYKARHKVDKTEYAIKKVVIPAKKIRQMRRKSSLLAEKMKEVYALSQLTHPNVVRYHHSWVERQEIGGSSTSKKNGSSSSRSSGSELQSRKPRSISQSKAHTVITSSRVPDNETSETADEETTSSPAPASYSDVDESFPREVEQVTFQLSLQDLSADLDEYQAKDEPCDEGLVVFGHSSKSKPEDEWKERAKYTDEHNHMPRQWFDEPTEADVILYIQMKAYESTLYSLLQGGSNNNMIPQHCFHVLPTIRILITIIDGLQYIHRRGIIHQDIKPGNIFLSVLEAGEPTTPAYVNITDCPDCLTTGPVRPLYICPHIGDFGMIKEIKTGLPTDQAPETETDSEATDVSTKRLLYSNLSAYKAGDSFLAGTGFYKPPWIRGIKPIICPKRDCYALGAVALEMICRFGSKSERVHVFSQVRDQGVFPREVREHRLGECIMGMLESDREKRWELARVKGFLVDLEKTLCR